MFKRVGIRRLPNQSEGSTGTGTARLDPAGQPFGKLYNTVFCSGAWGGGGVVTSVPSRSERRSREAIRAQAIHLCV